jgi:hypothetical protein
VFAEDFDTDWFLIENIHFLEGTGLFDYEE